MTNLTTTNQLVEILSNSHKLIEMQILVYDGSKGWHGYNSTDVQMFDLAIVMKNTSTYTHFSH